MGYIKNVDDLLCIIDSIDDAVRTTPGTMTTGQGSEKWLTDQMGLF
ncbi:hypothetical protein BH24ACT15_BH24ACT15_36420 [soil metagenome]